MNHFVAVEYYPRHILRDSNKVYVDSNSPQLATTKAYIRLDAFMELDELEEYAVYIKYRESDGPVQQFKASHCYLSRTVGLGINGICTDIYLTEQSYHNVMVALGLESVGISIEDVNF